MKMKRFLLFFLCLCWQIPSYASTSATDGFATELFTFDSKLAPIKLEHVDFKIERHRTAEEYGKEIGKYNFKLFGCRRADKKIMLDQGRAMRRDMKFSNVFFEEMNELFPVVVDKDNPYYPYSIGDKLPSYIITAEIQDLYVNACDVYDWRTRVYSNLRNGSAEIKVLWRVMTPYNRKIYWEDSTHGYATIEDPVRDGEIRLVEKAFADALTRIVGTPGFLEVMQNKPDPNMLAELKNEYDDLKYQHLQSRNKIRDFYRRKRQTFYTERKRQREFELLEHLAPTEKELSDFEKEQERLRREKLAKFGKGGTENDLDGMGKGDTSSDLDNMGVGGDGKLLQDGMGAEEAGRLLSNHGYGDDGFELGDRENGIMTRLLQNNLERADLGRMLRSTPLMRLFDGYLFPDDMDDEQRQKFMNMDIDKYGFTISPTTGWITIKNTKPFRNLTPARIYRIRSSLVAVVTNTNVGSGVLVAPSLILTNYETIKDSPYTKIEFLDGRTADGIILRVHKPKDVALIYIQPNDYNKYNWPMPLRIDLPEVGEKFYSIGTPMRGGLEGAMDYGKIAGYRYFDNGIDLLTNTNVQSVTLGGALVDEHGNTIGLSHAGESLADQERDYFIPIGDAFDALKVRILDREMDESPTQKALRLKKAREDYIK